MKFEMAKNSLFAVLLRSPWWMSAVIAAGIFAGLRLVLPQNYAFFVALPFIAIGGYALWQQLRSPSEARVAGALEAIRAMSWDEFSGAIERAFGRDGYSVSRPSGTQADFELVRARRISLVACKRWKAARTGVEPLRELLAERRARDAHECIYVAAGEISDNALAFAAEYNIRLLQGAELAKLLRVRSA
jgi:restriction system protein